MKNLLFFGLIVALFSACQSGPPQWTTTAPEIDVAKALLKDYADGNWEGWMSHYADTAKVFHNTVTASSPKELQEALTGTIANLTSYGFSDKEIFYERIIDDKGDHWVYFWGNWEGKVKTTDKELVVPVHLALKFSGDKIIREYGYYDFSTAMTAFAELAAATKQAEESTTK